MPVEVGVQSRGIVLPGLADETADSRLHDLLRVVGEEVGEGKDVVQIAGADEEPGRDHGGPASERVCRTGQHVQRRPIAVVQVAAHDMWRCPVDQVPRVDQVMLVHVKLVEGRALLVRDPAASGTEIHDAHRPHTMQVLVRRQEQSDIAQGHVDHRLAEAEHLAHGGCATSRELLQGCCEVDRGRNGGVMHGFEHRDSY